MTDLWQQYQFLHPDRFKSPETLLTDDSFDDFARELEAETRGVLYPDTVVIPYGGQAPVFLSTDDQWEDVP